MKIPFTFGDMLTRRYAVQVSAFEYFLSVQSRSARATHAVHTNNIIIIDLIPNCEQQRRATYQMA